MNSLAAKKGLLHYWKLISYIGTGRNKSSKKKIIISNQLAFLFLMLAPPYLILFRNDLILLLIAGIVAICSGSTLLLNYIGYSKTSRILISTVPSLQVFLSGIIISTPVEGKSSPATLLLLSLVSLPFVLFSLREWKLLLSSFLFTFLCFIGFYWVDALVNITLSKVYSTTDVMYLTSVTSLLIITFALVYYKQVNLNSNKDKFELLKDIREKEELLRSIMKTSPIPIVISKISDGKILYANDKAASGIGMEASKAFMGKSTKNFYYKPEQRKEIIKNLLEKEELNDVEISYRRSDGSSGWASVNLKIITYNGEKVILTASMDITERKIEQLALAESEERFRKFSEASFEGIILHENGLIQDANKEMVKMFGYENSELIGKNIYEIIHEKYHDKIRTILSSAEEKPIQSLGVTKDGKTFAIVSRAKNISVNGKQMRVGAIRDISERVKIEEQLRQVIDFSPMPVVIASKVSGTILYVNEKLCDTFGYSPEAMIGKISVEQVFIDPEERMRARRILKENNKLNNEEMLMKKKDGRKMWMLMSATEIQYDGQECIMGAFQDITARKLALEEIKKRTQIIEQKNKEIDASLRYARNIQHAILPAQDKLERLVPESFIFHASKEIVCGDFCWLDRFDDKMIIAVIDCTGHGVPAALMTIIGNTQLNYIIREMAIHDPAAILKALDGQIKQILQNDDMAFETHDGMDVSLCIISENGRKVKFAGADRPMYVMHRNELHKIKGEPYPVGGYQIKDKSFKTHTLSLEEGDLIYLVTDGFVDQLGGNFQKKFMSRNFEKLVHECCAKPMDEQQKYFRTAFEEWKGNTEQTDDVLVIGIKV